MPSAISPTPFICHIRSCLPCTARIYDERMSAMKTGWMNPLNTAANLALQVSMAAVMAKNNDFTAAAFRLLFKGYAALGFC